MMEDLAFSLDRVLPYFLLMLAGGVLRRFSVVPSSFFSTANKFVYHVALPANLFLTCLNIDWALHVNSRLLLFTAFVVLLGFSLIWLACEIFCRNKGYIGTIVQCATRGNFAILGATLLIAVLGDAAAAPVALLVAILVPMYSTMGVIALLTRGKSSGRRKLHIRRLLLGVITAPPFAGTVLGILWGLTGLPRPYFFTQTFDYMGQCVAGLALMSVGGVFNWKLARDRLVPSLWAAAAKTVFMPALTLSLAWLAGFRGQELLILFVVSANPTAVAAYTSACELDGDGPLASNILIITTISSAFILSLGIYIMRAVGRL